MNDDPTNGFEAKVYTALSRIASSIKLYNPIEVFGLYSGGHDSFSSCYIASLHPRFSGVIHINTGIGVEATRDHVRSTCRRRGWKIWEYKAVENVRSNGEPDPKIYDEWVIKGGFPGPGQHHIMYSNLKERALSRLERDCGACARGKNPSRVLYITGARSQESERRMSNTKIETEVCGRAIWQNPIHDWTKIDTSICIEFAKAKRNPVVDLIHKSGECLCGSFAKPGELQELALWPETRPAYERIIALQNRVLQAGFPWGWGHRPPKEYMETKRGQLGLFKNERLCFSCNIKATA